MAKNLIFVKKTPLITQQLKQFEEKAPEIVFEWNDSETEAKGWMVINSLRGGAAGGGTRMRKGLDKREVISLAKTMEVKFAVSGPAIGGAKSGIDFDPADPRKKEVLQRWYKALMPILKAYYGTGGDLNIDEIHEVIQMTENYGLWHPQEGVVNGHFGAKESDKIKRLGQLRLGVSKIIEDIEFSPSLSKKYKVADMITGFGVAQSVLSYYSIRNIEAKGKRVIIQGWGNVASAAAFFLAKKGLKIVGIIDRSGGIISHQGLTLSEVTDLFNLKVNNTLVSESLKFFDEVNQKIWDLPADVFLPCAASRLVTKDQVDRLLKNKLEVIASGANVPFADQEIFYGPIARYADENTIVIPDFVANCGMARVFAYLMSSVDVEISDQSIFDDVSKTIHTFIKLVLEKNNTPSMFTKTSYELTLHKLS